ncbi:DUF5960 family protein [Enterococcus pallens]|uniref:Uncharacterized protein n=1 Tax=Enterococcus pallens ATCC BAA-351 TaxID=1158607 RepID=R2SG13_9ENTE|nr:DUF5960 family protein [Enterococcus pallens]EOH91826.1 hypothetical protein UAU_03128 [Enterococcus pallens ATCC BAA-351]EOU25254.1 hypothetical protein I588_01242 [Enterococcus pallens ATCC BAA-351]
MLDTNGAVFEFKSEEDDQFTKDYHRLVDSAVPLFAVKEDLLYLMESQGINYFMMPAIITRDRKDHCFYFEVETFETSRVKKYKYLRCD